VDILDDMGVSKLSAKVFLFVFSAKMSVVCLFIVKQKICSALQKETTLSITLTITVLFKNAKGQKALGI